MTMDVAGRLLLAPGSAEPITFERPMVGAGLMRRVTEGRRAALIPDLFGSVFALGAAAQRATSRRAIRCALGLDAEPAAVVAAEGQALAMATARDHLQRFALDLPSLLPMPGVPADPRWLRDAPVLALSPRAEAGAVRAAAAALPSWLERRLFGCTPAAWRARWSADAAHALADWAAAAAHPLARWLLAVQPRARALRLPCRPLALLGDGEAGLRALVDALAQDEDLPEHPLWNGAPAETAPWTRHGRCEPCDAGFDVWHRLGARLADLAALADGAGVAFGALELAAGEAIAWTEMSRGLLLHWVRLDDGPRHADTARIAAYRVFSPTEWNFHPQGAFGHALAEGRFDADDARLAALALDPCVRVDLQGPVHA